MGQRMRDFPRAQTSLGEPEHWPLSLKSSVAMLLQCPLPMYIAWGPQYIQFYNDAYRPIFGDKHPVVAANRYLLTPAIDAALAAGQHRRAVHALRRSLWAEAGVACVVLALVAWLGVLSPQP